MNFWRTKGFMNMASCGRQGTLVRCPQSLLNIDVKGARTIQKAFGEHSGHSGNLVSIFIS